VLQGHCSEPPEAFQQKVTETARALFWLEGCFGEELLRLGSKGLHLHATWVWHLN